MSEATPPPAGGTTFEFEDKSYAIPPRDFEIEVVFSKYLETEALRGIQRNRQALGPQDYNEMLRGWRQDVASGQYDFGGYAAAAACFSPSGMKKLAHLFLSKGQPRANIDMMLVEKIFKDEAKFGELISKIAEAGVAGEAPATPAQT